MHMLVGEDAGIVVPYLDVSGLTDAITKLYSDRALCATLGKRARERVQANHYVDVIAPQILNSLPELISVRDDDYADALKREIDNCDVVSFDIFDTLVTRRVSNPNVVFDIIENHHTRQQSAPIPFIQERMNTAGAVLNSKKGAVDDVSINEIYRHMPFFNSEHAEKSIEIDLCVPHPIGQSLYQHAVEQKKTIYISSDMYLDRHTIETILRKNSITHWDKLFLSSDIGRKKDTGRLYDSLKLEAAEIGVDPQKILHIGDNWKGDIEFARRANLRAVRISPPQDQFQKLISLSQSSQVGLSQAGRLWDSFCQQANSLWRSSKHPYTDDVLTRIGFEVSGPLSCMMAIFAKQQAVACGARKIVFMARDGRIIKRAFDALYSTECASGEFESLYVHLSRSTVVPATLEHPLTSNDLYFLVDGLHLAQKNVRYFVAKTGLDTECRSVDDVITKHFPSQDFIPDWSHLSTLTNMFRDLSGALHEQNNEKRAAFQKYLQTNGLLEEGPILVVDVGWLLNIQSRLCRLFTAENSSTAISGCYVGSNDRVNKSMAHSSLLFDHGEPSYFANLISSNVTLFEVLFSAPEASAKSLGLAPNGEPIVTYKPLSLPPSSEFLAAQKLQMGAEDFINAFSEAREVFFPERISRDYFFELFLALTETKNELVKATLNELEVNLGGNHEFTSKERLLEDGKSIEYKIVQGTEYFSPIKYSPKTASPQRILIVTSAGLDNGSTRYRSLNLADSLTRNLAACTVVHAATPLREAETLIEDADTVIFQRCFAEQGNVGQFIKFAQNRNKRCLAELDDLVLPEFVPTIGSVAGGQWNIAQAMEVAKNYENTLKEVSGCIVSTPVLKNQIEKLYRLPCTIIRNKVTPDKLRRPAPADRAALRLAYASGTYSHREDFAIIENLLYKFLKEHKDVRLDVLGAAQLTERMLALDNVFNYPLLAYDDMLSFIAARDLMLVPLVDNIFNRAKSSVKFVECGAVGTPVLASDVGEFSHAIEHGKNGLLTNSPEDWIKELEAVYRAPKSLDELAQNAFETVKSDFCTRSIESESLAFLLNTKR